MRCRHVLWQTMVLPEHAQGASSAAVSASRREAYWTMRKRSRVLPLRAHAGNACQTKCYSRHAASALRPRGASGALLPRLITPPLADTSDLAVIAKLRALHPEAAPPTTLSTDVPAIQITEETLVAVERPLSATSKGKGAGVTGWTYERILVAVQVSSEGRRAVLQFINLILAGTLPRVEIEYLCGHWSWYRYRSWLRWHHAVVMMHGHVGAIGCTSSIV